MGSVFGNIIRVSLFGQSHGDAVGAVIDGLPAGDAIDLEKLQRFLRRRAPGGSPLTTARREEDQILVLSGVSNGMLCGAPFAAIIKNHDIRSDDYLSKRATPRPGHADYPAGIKYRGANDFSGGGHFSARLTAALCIAGGLCLQLLQKEGIRIAAHILSIGDVGDAAFDPMAPQIDRLLFDPLCVLDKQSGLKMATAIQSVREEGDSLGGVIECAAVGLPVGLGEPMFSGLENRIAAAIFAIPAVKGIMFGNGFEAASLRGSENNDPFRFEGDRVVTQSNRNGGILGGLSTGMPLLFRTAFKPTPSIVLPQNSVDLETGSNTTLHIRGRHDPCIVPRAVPVVEAAAALALYDAYLDFRKEANV